VLAPASAAEAHICNEGTSGLTSRWSAEGDARDHIAGNDGVVAGGAGFVPGKVGLAFDFDGSGAFVDVSDNPTLDPFGCSFTIEAWIHTGLATGVQTVAGKAECAISCRPGLSSSLYYLRVVDGRLQGILRDSDAGGPDAGGTQQLSGTRFVADGRCHHVAMVRDLFGSQLRLYVDGRLDAQDTLNDGGIGTIVDDDQTPDPFTIGARYLDGTVSPTDLFQGWIDELGLHNIPLTGAQIRGIVRSAGRGPCPPREPRGPRS
jgi:hypothetical protein